MSWDALKDLILCGVKKQKYANIYLKHIDS